MTVEITLKRPGWNAWLLGATHTQRLTVRAPVAHVTSRWLTAPAGSPVNVRFTTAVTTVAYGGHTVHGTRSAVAIPAPHPAGSVRVRLAARTWESLGRPALVRWFPRTNHPVALVSPAPDGKLSPAGPIRLTFAQPVKDVLGGAHPKLSPAVPGRWKQPNRHTLEFIPTGYGVQLGSHEQLTLPHTLGVADPLGRHAKAGRQVAWTVPGASTLRLNQLLAQAGYLPVKWTPDGRRRGPDAARRGRRRRGPARRPLLLALRQHAARAQEPVGRQDRHGDHPGRDDDVPGRAPHDRGRRRRPGRVEVADGGRDQGRQAALAATATSTSTRASRRR